MQLQPLGSSNYSQRLAGKLKGSRRTRLLSWTWSRYDPPRLHKVRSSSAHLNGLPFHLFLAASSPLYYITALTALFESIAMIVDQHQPVVESYYGTGKMASVIARLLQECDRVCKGLIEGWEEERAMKRKVGKRLARRLCHG